MSARSASTIVAVCTLAGFSAAGAQEAVGADSTGAWARGPLATSCPDSLDPAMMTSSIIYLDASMPRNTPSAFAVQGDLLASEVDIELRRMLGGSASVVPNADTIITWRAVPSELVVSAHADGTMTWPAVSQSRGAAATRLLSLALDSARARGGALLIFPEGYSLDRLDFRLSLRPDSRQLPVPSAADAMKFGAFRVRLPIFSPALPIKGSAIPVYPHNNERRLVTGQLTVQFAVDTTGRADMSTFSDVWPRDTPRLTGTRGGYYDDFVSSVRNYVAQEKFTPARFGSCRVRQWVRWPVMFKAPTGSGAYTESH